MNKLGGSCSRNEVSLKLRLFQKPCRRKDTGEGVGGGDNKFSEGLQKIGI